MLSVRLPEDMHAALVRAAAKGTIETGQRVTVSDLVRILLAATIKAFEEAR